MKGAEDGSMGSRTVGLMIRAARGEVSDRELLERFAAGDQAAFAALVRRHSDLVMGVCRRSLATEQDAEDACQATFLILSRKAANGRWQPSIANWLHATARRVASNARRAAERRARREHRAAVPEATTPIDTISGRELLALLDEELANLPALYREPLILCYLAGLTRDEAAARLQIPATTIKTRLDRGRQRLAHALTRRGCALGVGLLALAVSSRSAASAPRGVDAILAAVGGRAPPAVAAFAEEAAVNTFAKKSILIAAAVAVALIGAGIGLAPRTAAQPHPEPELPPLTREARPAAGIPVSGRVLDPDGTPVAGAKFAVIDDDTGAAVPQLVSDAAGRFAFELPRTKEVRNPRQVVASAPGFGLAWRSEPRENAEFKLVPDLPISGRVIDLQGQPVAGASVLVHNIHTGPPDALDAFLVDWKKSAKEQKQAVHKLDRALFNRGGLGDVFRATTDKDGRFTLAGLGKDRVVTLLMTGNGIADTFADIVTRAGFDPSGAPRSATRLYAPKFDLAVAPDKPITGVVRDEATKAPVAGVRVSGASQFGPLELERHTNLFHAWPTPWTTTDKEGRFTLRGLAKASAYILVADPDEGTEHLHRFGLVRDTDGVAPITAGFSLPRGVVVTGRMTDAVTGAPAPSRVFYRPLEKNEFLGQFGGYDPPDYPAPWHRGRDTKTDYDGRYKITVMPGAGVLNFQAYGGPFERAHATKQEIDDGIVDKQFGHFPCVGQGGMFNPEYMNAYRIIDPKLTDRTMALDVTFQPAKAKDGK
jgi:RNA polymerase sigma factor (sigma-70 family)